MKTESWCSYNHYNWCGTNDTSFRRLGHDNIDITFGMEEITLIPFGMEDITLIPEDRVRTT